MKAFEDTEDGRFVSRMTRQTLALVLAGGQGSRLHEMPAHVLDEYFKYKSKALAEA